MTLRPGEVPGRGIAVFPFLKTSEPVRLGNFTFRSTDDTADLSEEDSAHVREIAEMLFLQDDLRIRSAAYAMLPALDLDKADRTFGSWSTSRRLSRIATVLPIQRSAIRFYISSRQVLRSSVQSR